MAANYPFDDDFRKAFDESDYGWSCLLAVDLTADMAVMTHLIAAGYTLEQVRAYVQEVNDKPIDELINLALLDDSDDPPALAALQIQTSRAVFDKAKVLCSSPYANERVLGVEIIMRKPGRTYRPEAVDIVCTMARDEADEHVLEVLSYALKHLDVENRSEYLHRLVDCPNEDTRFAVAYSLGGLNDPTALTDMIALSRDTKDETRDWATFGLHLGMDAGEEREDRQDVRDALYDRLTDPHEDTRYEALDGLAKHKDPRVLEPLLAALQEESVFTLAVDAAKEIGDPSLYESLVELRDWWDVDSELLEEAIESCNPKKSHQHSGGEK